MTDVKINESIEVPRLSIKWMDVGSLSGKGSGYICSCLIDEKTVKEEVLERRKLGQFKIRRSDVSSLSRSEKRRKIIEEVCKSNPTIGKEMSEKFHEDIKNEAIEFVEVMFGHFTPALFHEFLARGGSVDVLYEDTKKKFQ